MKEHYFHPYRIYDFGYISFQDKKKYSEWVKYDMSDTNGIYVHNKVRLVIVFLITVVYNLEP